MAGEFVTWDQIQPLLWFAISITGLIVFFKLRYTHIKNYQKKIERERKKENSIEAVIDRKLNEIPGQLQKVNAELAHLEKTGANDAQMKSLKDKKRLLELGRDYGDIAAEMGKPLIKSITSMVKGMAGGV